MNDKWKDRLKKIVGLGKEEEAIHPKPGRHPNLSQAGQVDRPTVESLGSMANGIKSDHSARSSFGVRDHPLVSSGNQEIPVIGRRIESLGSPHNGFGPGHSTRTSFGAQDPEPGSDEDQQQPRIIRCEPRGSYANGSKPGHPKRQAFGTEDPKPDSDKV